MDYPLDNYEAIIISQAEVRPGDVILCYSGMTADEETAKPLGYSHVAIALNDQRVLEATSSGVHVVPLDELLDDYEHLAVLRAEGAWGQSELQKLEQFAQRQIGKAFNLRGMVRVRLEKGRNSEQLMANLEAYFEGTLPPETVDRLAYFCSELVASAFIEVGIVDASASFVLLPRILSPSDIGLDKAFGCFCGYVLRRVAYAVPEGDYFRRSV